MVRFTRQKKADFHSVEYLIDSKIDLGFQILAAKFLQFVHIEIQPGFQLICQNGT